MGPLRPATATPKYHPTPVLAGVDVLAFILGNLYPNGSWNG